MLLSTLVPILNRVTSQTGPELAILPTAVIPNPSSPTNVAGTVTTAAPTILADRSVSLGTTSMNESLNTGTSSLELPARRDGLTSQLDPAASTDASNQSLPASHDRSAFRLPGQWILGTLFLVWCAGVCYHLMRGMIGMLICRRLVANTIPLDSIEYNAVLSRLQGTLNLRRLPLISTTAHIGSPAVIGTWRPQIVLPAAALPWMSADQLFQVLMHETARIVRRDPLINFLQMVSRALFWQHPLVHWLNRCLSESREAVLQGTTDKAGRCEFKGIPKKGQVELVWWGDAVVSGRADHLEALEEATGFQITLPDAAQIHGKLDRKAFPKVGRINISPKNPAAEPRHVDLKPDQLDFKIGNLAPGRYSINLMSPLEPAPGLGEGALTNRILTTVWIDLDVGEDKQVNLPAVN